jgi:hypothetical protein
MRIALDDYCWQPDAEARREMDDRDWCLNAYWDAQERAATPSPPLAPAPPEDPAESPAGRSREPASGTSRPPAPPETSAARTA